MLEVGYKLYYQCRKTTHTCLYLVVNVLSIAVIITILKQNRTNMENHMLCNTSHITSQQYPVVTRFIPTYLNIKAQVITHFILK